VLTALNIAEAVKTKLLIVAGLRERIKSKQLENAVRDFIAEHPWLISPEWELFKKERSVKNLMKDIGDQVGYTAKAGEKRIDLALSNGQHLLILEFMKPGETLDWDHLSRFERYVRKMRSAIKVNTAGDFKVVTGYIVADKLDKDSDAMDKIESMKRDDMFAMDWRTLLSKAGSKWKDFLSVLSNRGDDPRLKALLDDE
jgi:RecB family endonuclease NucS